MLLGFLCFRATVVYSLPLSALASGSIDDAGCGSTSRGNLLTCCDTAPGLRMACTIHLGSQQADLKIHQ